MILGYSVRNQVTKLKDTHGTLVNLKDFYKFASSNLSFKLPSDFFDNIGFLTPSQLSSLFQVLSKENPEFLLRTFKSVMNLFSSGVTHSIFLLLSSLLSTDTFLTSVDEILVSKVPGWPEGHLKHHQDAIDALRRNGKPVNLVDKFARY